MKLSKLQRLGLVASAVWFLGVSYTTFENESKAYGMNTAAILVSCEAAHNSETVCYQQYSEDISRWLPIVRQDAILTAAVPIPFLWLAAYCILALVRWVIKS